MRVEQDIEHGETSANSNQMLINQLREITGIQDLHVLQSTLNASQGDISQAIGVLTTQTMKEEQMPEEPTQADNERNTSNTQNGPAKDDLQTAIELSLQESQQAEAERRELHRALEVSAEENAAQMKRKRCEASGESCSPVDWIRQEDWPVGIRNVGNTCWFSAVIQSLYHLPVFRRLVLNYCLSERVLEKCKSHSEKRNIAFMQELRCLFALMVGSNRRFVDPSAAVELLRDAFRTSEAQQDVSEFSHKLLDWLEDAFQLAANGTNPEDKQNNPMVQLFYGTFVAERLLDGKIVSNIEQFGQYPLQVNGFNNLDECLEGAMVEGEIESLHSDQKVPTSQERWFSKLPPVLTFELSRFEFNQSLGRPEKIHKKLEFPQVIYMDRYLHKNVYQTHGRRGEVKRLKDQLTILQQRLEGYKHYGSGPTKYPLADMLQYVLEFATMKPANMSPASPVPLNPPVPIEPSSGDTSQTEPDDTRPSDGLQTATQRTPIHKPFTQCRPSLDIPLQPAPHSVTEEELHFVIGCLQRWRAEVENTINELKASIDKVSQALEGMYSDNSLCQVPYRLHAVLVHEGQASAGHYWAYIYDHSNKRWLKYNDVMVTESTWEELVRDSYGGMTNASAYCLMYINDDLPYLIAEDTDNETGQVVKGMDSLPSILRRYVREDNRWFQQELREWEEQFCQAQRDESCHQALTSTNTEEPVPEQPQHQDLEPHQEPAHENTNEVTEEQTPYPAPPEPAQQCEEPVASQADLNSISSEATENVRESAEEHITSNQAHSHQNEEKSEESQQSEAESASKDGVETEVEVEAEEKVNSDEAEPEADTDTQPESEATSAEENPAAARRRQPENEVSEVEIPNVGKILVRSDADGYNEEMMLTPAMQGVILAIAKAREAFDKDGPEAGLIKAFHEEYSRLHELSQEETTPQQDPRLQHVLVYLFQNQAPGRVIERTLLEQFIDRNLSFDDRAISIMREARTKLRLIKPEDMDMDEYLQWHEDYSMFKTVFAYLLTGLEQYQNGKIREALNYLAHAHQDNSVLLRKGEKRGVDQSLIALYRRKCLKELNENAATLFKKQDENDEGVVIMNECVIPCMHLMVRDTISQEDLDVIELIRNCWCSYLGQDMDDSLQEKLSEFLPRVLDCSAERVVLKEPPKTCFKVEGFQYALLLRATRYKFQEPYMAGARIRAKFIKSGQTKNGEFILLEQNNPNRNIDKTITHNELKQPLMEKRAEFLRMDQFQVIVCLEVTVGTSGMTEHHTEDGLFVESPL
ncbi:ubiquitin carboxyl-terminal hydrolase 28 isoform X3 [Triplophysa dalaica]|uniref:ubiquitin carboxyl-terminal hydrolase 28 isoform X3 n=1 Tax=Triplophysa dalaica TaxID=1582913 RepID=UPI0024DF374E|nr:ubiquitin carboxyl-terminal hydrolase 28 isoform X3 [Triplophysa dalaica]